MAGDCRVLTGAGECASATNPLALTVSANPHRNGDMAGSVWFFLVVAAWWICIKRGPTSRSPGGWRRGRDSELADFPPPTSSRCSRKTSIPVGSAHHVGMRQGAAGEQVVRCTVFRTHARMPGRSTSETVVIGESSGNWLPALGDDVGRCDER